jgi:hypothetical protein
MYFSTGVGNIKEFFNTKRALQFAQSHRSCAVPTDATPQPKVTLYDVDAVYIYQCIPIFILWNYACQRWSRTLIGLKLYTWCVTLFIFATCARDIYGQRCENKELVPDCFTKQTKAVCTGLYAVPVLGHDTEIGHLCWIVNANIVSVCALPMHKKAKST